MDMKRFRSATKWALMGWWCSTTRAQFRIEAMQEERIRVARELHDTVAAGLIGLKLQIERALDVVGDDERARESLEAASRSLQWNLAEVRRAMLGLRSELLDRYDLATALRISAVTVTKGLPMKVSATVRGATKRTGCELENHLLRIGQEAITNALRHAYASRIEIDVNFGEDVITMTIRDNGATDTTGNENSETFGLRGIRERILEVGGDIRVRNVPGEGTSVIVVAPLPERKEERSCSWRL